MQVYDAKKYQEYLRFRLGLTSGDRKRGSIKSLAEHIKCHQTYVSQVVRSKAHLSNEQAIRCCQYFDLNDDEAEFFIDLLNRDKAGDDKTRRHFQRRIERRKADRLNMKKRWKTVDHLTAEQEIKYYESWIPQAVHVLCQLGSGVTPEETAKKLRVGTETAGQALKNLADIGLVEAVGDRYRSIKDNIHLGIESPSIVRSHVNWRAKATSDLTELGIRSGTHYSSVVSMSPADVAEIKKLIYEHLEASRSVILKSPSEQLFCYLLDFFPVTE